MGGRLKDGVTIAQANAELHAIGTKLEKEYPDDNSGKNFAVMNVGAHPGTDRHGRRFSRPPDGNRVARAAHRVRQRGRHAAGPRGGAAGARSRCASPSVRGAAG